MAADGSVKISTALDTKETDRQLAAMGSTIKTGLTATITAATAALGGMAVASVKVGSAFEAAMSQVAATMGTTVDKIPELTEIAREMGEATKFSATQAAEALNYLALAGYDSEKSIAALPTVLDLAAAGGMDLAYASDLVTDSMSVLGMSTDELTGFVDQMAKTSQKSNTNVAQLGEAILVAGGQAKLAGMDTVDLNTALGILADNGLKGSEGGTALRNALKNLYTPTKEAAGALEELGIYTVDSNGNLRDTQTVLQELSTALDGLSEGDRMNAMAAIFDTRTIAAGNALLKDSGQRWDELSGHISEAEGAAAAMAATMNDNLQGDMTILGSALEGLGIQIFDSFTAPLRLAAKESTKSVGAIAREFKSPVMMRALDTLGDGFSDLIDGIAELASKAIPGAVKGIALLIDNGEDLAGILLSVGAGIAAFKTLSLVIPLVTQLNTAWTSATTLLGMYSSAQALWNLAMAANPAMTVAVAIGVLVAGIGILITVLGDSNDEFEQFKKINEDVIETNNAMTDSLKDSAKAHENNIAEMEGEAKVAKDLSNEIYALAGKTNKTAEEKAKLKVLVERLNTLMPELNLAYDEQADKLNLTKEATDALIESQRKKIEMAAAEERAIQLAKDRYETEKQLAESSTNLEAAKLRLADAETKMGEAVKNTSQYAGTTQLATYAQVQSEVNALTESHQALEEEYRLSGDELDALTQKSADYALEVAETADTTQDDFEKMQEALKTFASVGQENIVELLTTLGFVDEALEDQISALEDYEAVATDMWGRISEAEKVSLEEMIANLDYNAEAVEKWSQDLETLSKRGIDEGLIASLKAAGPEARVSISELVDASDEELGKLEEAFAKGGQAAVNALLRDVDKGDLVRPLTDAMGEAASTLEADTQLEDAVAAKGAGAKEALAASIEEANFTESGGKAMENTATGVTESTHLEDSVTEKTTKTKEHSMTEVENNKFIEVGDKIQENEAKGVKDSDALKKAVTEEIKSAKTEADSAVKANNFNSVGLNISEGIAAGILSGMSAIASAIREVISNALSEAESEADAHSPARAFIPLGINIDEGVGVGIERSLYSAEAARGIISRAYKAVDSGPMQMSQYLSGAAVGSAGGNIIFEPGAIVIDGAPIDNTLDAEKVGRDIGAKAANEIRLRGGFPG